MATYVKVGKKHKAIVRKKGKSKSATFATKAEAVRWATELETMIERGEYTGTPAMTFAELLDKYLKEITPTKRGKREERYRLLRIAKEPLGEIYLSDLTKDDFKKWQNKRLTQVSADSVLRERTSISAVIKQAMQWDYLTVNPLTTLEKTKATAPRDRRYSEEEIEKIVYISGYDMQYQPITCQSRVVAAFLFAIETAMRAGEICGLTWDCVNFEKRTAFLPKTKNGYSRTVPLSTKAIEILRHLSFFESDDERSVFRLNTAQTLMRYFAKLSNEQGLLMPTSIFTIHVEKHSLGWQKNYR